MSAEAPSPDENRFHVHFRARLSAGLILAIPLWITLVMASFVFGVMRDASWWLFAALLMSPVGAPLLDTWGVAPEQLRTEGIAILPAAVRWGVSLLSIALTVSAVYGLGLVTTNVMGRRAVDMAEALVDRVPLVKTVYRASKQVLETFAGDAARPFQKVVLVPFPTERMRSVGFVTREARDTASGDRVYTVFVATTPNPTTGFVFVVRACDVTELDWTIEQAIQVVMSGGVLLPDEIPLGPPAEHPGTPVHEAHGHGPVGEPGSRSGA